MSAFETDMSRAFNLRTTTSTHSQNPSWESRYEELLQWRAIKGDTCVPKAEGALGRWVARQRELKRTGKLDPGREQALNSINFVWNTVTAMWEERFRRLSEWKRIHGHCAVPIAQGELGTWVSKQRQLRKRGKLSKEKVAALNSLNFTWSTAEADWEDKFKRLCEWTRQHGHASVPFNEGELGWWVNTQRQCKRKGKLSPTRESRLQSLGFVWNPSNSRSRAANAAAAMLSSVDTTPSSTPVKQEKISENDANDIFNFQIGLDVRDDINLYQETQSAFSGVNLPSTMINPTVSQPEAISSPQAGTLNYGFWSPSLCSSPMLNPPALNASPIPNPIMLHTHLHGTSAFGIGQTLQSHSDSWEHFLSRDDGVLLDHPPIDSLTCEEDI